jgi:hypothetical protein
MATLFNPHDAQVLSSRLDNLKPDSPALWGKMNAHQMVCHMTDSCKVALGETPTTPRPGFLSTRFARWLIISVLPIPRGKAETSREFKLTQPAEWAADLARLKEGMQRMIERAALDGTEWNIQPAFGKLTTSEQGKLFAKHFDHHLRQFGV